MFSKKIKITKLWKKIPKEINNNNYGLIQLFISKISPNYVVFYYYNGNKRQIYWSCIIRKNDIKKCCNIFFKGVELIICVSVWLMLLNKYGLEN